MKKIILFLLLLIPLNYVHALTIDDEKNVRLECGVTLTYDEYLMIKRVSLMFDYDLDNQCEHIDEIILPWAKKAIYSGDYLVKSNINGGRTVVTKEEAYELIENKEDEYLICDSSLLLERHYIGHTLRDDKDFLLIFTPDEPDYDKYCNEEKILEDELKEVNKVVEKEMNIIPFIFNNKILTSSIVGIVLTTFIGIFIHSRFKKEKKKTGNSIKKASYI